MSGPPTLVPFSELVKQQADQPRSRLRSVSFVHGLLLVALAVSAVGLLASPCGGGGDLCLGAFVGLLAVALGLVILVGLGVRAAFHRSSILVAIDALFLVVIGPSALRSALSFYVNPATVLAFLVLVLALAGAGLAAREVSRHRTERTILVVALILVGVVFGLSRTGGVYSVLPLVVTIAAAVWPEPAPTVGPAEATD